MIEVGQIYKWGIGLIQIESCESECFGHYVNTMNDTELIQVRADGFTVEPWKLVEDEDELMEIKLKYFS
jgi:hypothetical protein